MKNNIQNLLDASGSDRTELRIFIEDEVGLSITRQCMHGYCLNQWQPSAPIKRAIAKYFDIPITDIFYNEK